jgi:hypothetical protein
MGKRELRRRQWEEGQRQTREQMERKRSPPGKLY